MSFATKKMELSMTRHFSMCACVCMFKTWWNKCFKERVKCLQMTTYTQCTQSLSNILFNFSSSSSSSFFYIITLIKYFNCFSPQKFVCVTAFIWFFLAFQLTFLSSREKPMNEDDWKLFEQKSFDSCYIKQKKIVNVSVPYVFFLHFLSYFH